MTTNYRKLIGKRCVIVTKSGDTITGRMTVITNAHYRRESYRVGGVEVARNDIAMMAEVNA